MIEENDFDALIRVLDARYKLANDCKTEMRAVSENINAHNVDIAVFKHDIKIIKWVACTTLGAAIVALVGAFLNLIIK